MTTISLQSHVLHVTTVPLYTYDVEISFDSVPKFNVTFSIKPVTFTSQIMYYFRTHVLSFHLFLTHSFLTHSQNKHACKQTLCCQCFLKPTSFCNSSDFQVQRVQAPLSLLPVLNTCQHLSKHIVTPTTTVCAMEEKSLFSCCFVSSHLVKTDLSVNELTTKSQLLSSKRVIASAMLSIPVQAYQRKKHNE